MKVWKSILAAAALALASTTAALAARTDLVEPVLRTVAGQRLRHRGVVEKPVARGVDRVRSFLVRHVVRVLLVPELERDLAPEFSRGRLP